MTAPTARDRARAVVRDVRNRLDGVCASGSPMFWRELADAIATALRAERAAERARVEAILPVFRSCGDHVYELDGCPDCAVRSLMVTHVLSALRAPEPPHE